MRKFVFYVWLVVGFLMVGAPEVDAQVSNSFYQLIIPADWTIVDDFRGIDKFSGAHSRAQAYANKAENLRYQYTYSYILDKKVDLKEFIQVHVDEFLEAPMYEDMCYLKEEQFHGYDALSYTFVGQNKANGIYCTGKVYAFHAKGYTFLFVNKFVPNKSGKRVELDIWSGLTWLPEDQWHFN